ncbi:protein of unknown function [Burkholderia multivorans]
MQPQPPPHSAGYAPPHSGTHGAARLPLFPTHARPSAHGGITPLAPPPGERLVWRDRRHAPHRPWRLA